MPPCTCTHARARLFIYWRILFCLLPSKSLTRRRKDAAAALNFKATQTSCQKRSDAVCLSGHFIRSTSESESNVHLIWFARWCNRRTAAVVAGWAINRFQSEFQFFSQVDEKIKKIGKLFCCRDGLFDLPLWLFANNHQFPLSSTDNLEVDFGRKVFLYFYILVRFFNTAHLAAANNRSIWIDFRLKWLFFFIKIFKEEILKINFRPKFRGSDLMTFFIFLLFFFRKN